MRTDSSGYLPAALSPDKQRWLDDFGLRGPAPRSLSRLSLHVKNNVKLCVCRETRPSTLECRFLHFALQGPALSSETQISQNTARTHVRSVHRVHAMHLRCPQAHSMVARHCTLSQVHS